MPYLDEKDRNMAVKTFKVVTVGSKRYGVVIDRPKQRPPHAPRYGTKPALHTIADWLKVGPLLVANGTTQVEITDRSPGLVTDPLSPSGEWGWQYGWRWLEPREESYAHTLPEEIFRCLPPQPPGCTMSVGEGAPVMWRWKTIDDAHDALSTAAFAWAKKKCEPFPTGPTH